RIERCLEGIHPLLQSLLQPIDSLVLSVEAAVDGLEPALSEPTQDETNNRHHGGVEHRAGDLHRSRPLRGRNWADDGRLTLGSDTTSNRGSLALSSGSTELHLSGAQPHIFRDGARTGDLR